MASNWLWNLCSIKYVEFQRVETSCISFCWGSESWLWISFNLSLDLTLLWKCETTSLHWSWICCTIGSALIAFCTIKLRVCAKQGRCRHPVLLIAETMLLALSVTTHTTLESISQLDATVLRWVAMFSAVCDSLNSNVSSSADLSFQLPEMSNNRLSDSNFEQSILISIFHYSYFSYAHAQLIYAVIAFISA